MFLAEPTVEVKRLIPKGTFGVKELALQRGDQADVSGICRLLDLAESSYYYEGAGYVDAKADMQVLAALIKLAGKKPTYGYGPSEGHFRRLTDELRKHKRFSDINSKRVRRLLKVAGIKPKKRRKTIFTTNSDHSFRRKWPFRGHTQIW